VSNPSTYSEALWVRQLHNGERPAFDALYRDQYIRVFYTAKRFVPDTQAAEDLATETFLKLWERLADFDNLAAMRSFLYLTVRNACINHLRTEGRMTARHQQLIRLLEQGDRESADNRQLMADLYTHIYEEIEKLSPRLKQVFLLSYIDGLSNEEIAARLRINNQSVRNDKTRALKQLRLSLAGREGLLLLFLLLSREKLFFG
jgi:RNA polymerase sigma-70 factor (family 1)